MRFYTKQHKFYCGIDLHARTMYVCILNQDGEIVVHRNMTASTRRPFLKAIAPYREDLVVCVECLFTWYLARRPVRSGGDPLCPGSCPLHEGHPWRQGQKRHDRCPENCRAAPRGHAAPGLCLSRRDARHPGPAPAPDVICMRKRAELLTHVQNTNSQYNLPEIGKKLAYKANRDGVAERFPDPAVQKSIEVDLALIGSLRPPAHATWSWLIVKTAKQHDANTLYLLHTVPGIGKILSLVLLYEIHDIQRFPGCRILSPTAAWSSAPKNRRASATAPRARRSAMRISSGPSPKRPSLFLRANPAGQTYLRPLEKKHGQGKALTVLAHQAGAGRL